MAERLRVVRRRWLRGGAGGRLAGWQQHIGHGMRVCSDGVPAGAWVPRRLPAGAVSCGDGVYFGLRGDREALSDVEDLAGMLEESVDELLTTPRRP